MEYRHIQKNIQSSPRKLRLVADMVRDLSPAKALETLAFVNKAAALPLAKAIKTALANVGSKDDVVFKSMEINEGMKLKRYHGGTAGRGRGRPFKRRWSHIKIVLSDEIEGKVTKATKGTNVTKVASSKGNVTKVKESKQEVEKEINARKEQEITEEMVEAVDEKSGKDMEDKNIVKGRG